MYDNTHESSVNSCVLGGQGFTTCILSLSTGFERLFCYYLYSLANPSILTLPLRWIWIRCCWLSAALMRRVFPGDAFGDSRMFESDASFILLDSAAAPMLLCSDCGLPGLLLVCLLDPPPRALNSLPPQFCSLTWSILDMNDCSISVIFASLLCASSNCLPNLVMLSLRPSNWDFANSTLSPYSRKSVSNFCHTASEALAVIPSCCWCWGSSVGGTYQTRSERTTTALHKIWNNNRCVRMYVCMCYSEINS